jgi:Lon protease-like protein
VSEEQSIQVNFGRPMALFPLDRALLLPHQFTALNIFEPRYVQMVENALDSSGQFAVAVFADKTWKQDYHGRPPLRPAVCIGHIAQRQKTSDGRYELILVGLCRARIMRELEPSSERLYRSAMLAPVGLDEEVEPKLYGVRERLRELFSEGPLSHLAQAERLLQHLRNEDISTGVILELVSFEVPTRPELRYKLLAEGDAGERADLLEHELHELGRMIERARAQRPEPWPKGMSWN